MNALRGFRTRNTSNRIDHGPTPQTARPPREVSRALKTHKYASSANFIVENCVLLRCYAVCSGNFDVGKEFLGFSAL